MAKGVIRLLLIVMIIFTCLQVNVHSMANGTGEIIGIHMSPDNKKLLIKVEGSVSLRESFVSAEPKLLVLDFDAAGFVDVQPLTRYKAGPVKIIQTDTRGASQRVFVDFRGPVIPEYRIKRIGSFFIVLLDEEDVIRAQAANAPSASNDANDGSKLESDVLSTPNSNILISNTLVEDDKIILQVIDKRNPEKRYNVTLDIDFKTLGFNSASVSAVKNRIPVNRPKRKKAGPKRKKAGGLHSLTNKGPRSKSVRVNFGPEDQGLFSAFKSGSKRRLRNSPHLEQAAYQKPSRGYFEQ